MKRIFDCTAVLAALFLFGLPMLLLALLVKLTSPGPVLYWSDRVGVGNEIFKMPKFRTMRIDTPAVATHLLSDPDRLSPRAFVAKLDMLLYDCYHIFVKCNH